MTWSDILSQIILGESAEEVAEKTLKYYASKAVADSLINDISFINPKTASWRSRKSSINKVCNRYHVFPPQW